MLAATHIAFSSALYLGGAAVFEYETSIINGANKLSKAISLGNDHAFSQDEKEDQDIAEGCRRLIKNTLICWNYLYLAKELGKDNNEERKKELMEAIRNDSVMRWSHFNLQGIMISRMKK
ncbi:Tn3 family transposase [Methylotuvimicrobium buryatense]|uniref:Tn3 family transposase n=1 Tax=Methylotuvimicrobium buryatense TaxID=95641 RepID=UPI0003469BE6|nr:Tn3 family transposase [Methylotuvimicrobium buryatense]